MNSSQITSALSLVPIYPVKVNFFVFTFNFFVFNFPGTIKFSDCISKSDPDSKLEGIVTFLFENILNVSFVFGFIKLLSNPTSTPVIS